METLVTVTAALSVSVSESPVVTHCVDAAVTEVGEVTGGGGGGAVGGFVLVYSTAPCRRPADAERAITV